LTAKQKTWEEERVARRGAVEKWSSSNSSTCLKKGKEIPFSKGATRGGGGRDCKSVSSRGGNHPLKALSTANIVSRASAKIEMGGSRGVREEKKNVRTGKKGRDKHYQTFNSPVVDRKRTRCAGGEQCVAS